MRKVRSREDEYLAKGWAAGKAEMCVKWMKTLTGMIGPPTALCASYACKQMDCRPQRRFQARRNEKGNGRDAQVTRM